MAEAYLVVECSSYLYLGFIGVVVEVSSCAVSYSD